MRYIQENQEHEISVRKIKGADMIEIGTDKPNFVLDRGETFELVRKISAAFGFRVYEE
jgi:hypothetical protein